MLTFQKRRMLLFAGLLAPGMAAMSAEALRAAAPGPAAALAQAAPAQGTADTSNKGNNLLGTVTAATADSLTLKLEKGGDATISITAQTRLLRTAPGEKTLKGATVIHLEDLATGDRVLVLRAIPGADPSHYTASAVVAMKQADIVQAHATQSEDWQKRGVGGIVKSIESPAPGDAAPASGATSTGATIMLGTAQPGRMLAVHLTPTTTIRRYAADSVNFADAKPATLADIHPGDQLRARGDRTPDGASVTAVEIVAGSFRNVAGTISAIDTTQNTLTVTDLATKKPVTLKLTAETQMRKLPAEMAQRLAARSGRGGTAGRAGAARAAGSANGPGVPGSIAAGPGAVGPGPGIRPQAADTPEAAAAGEPGRGRGDTASMLQHAPPVTLAELKKGDAIMVVAARDGGGSPSNAATAITLIAGVEPLLESSSGGASDSVFSASWNLSGSAGAEAAQ